MLLQRKCDSGARVSGRGECAASASRRKDLQRMTAGPSSRSDVPALVHDVLRSPGQPLDGATRALMAPRFGHDFSQVRVHADASASSSAGAVDAHAYTVGRHIVFGAGQYSPASMVGKRLLAHELTHVIQQSGASAQGTISLGSADGPTEREADSVAAQVVSAAPPSVSAPLALSRESRPVMRRWKITGNTATSDESSDTLGGLAHKAGGHFNDWKCIKPLSMRTATLAKPPANFDDHYELYVQAGDKFDISNLTAKTGPSVNIYLFNDGTEAMNANLAKAFYPGSASSSDADTEFDSASNSGSAPIGSLVIFGHAGGGTMWGAASSFTPSGFDPEEPKQSFALAHVGLFPRRCWFARNASARSVGCDSETWGEDFAAHYLRVGAKVVTTTKSVRPKCSAPLFSGGVCTAFDGLDFATSAAISAAMLDGPFWSAAAFHGGKYWKTIKGKL
jgi:hypothetical protein